MGEERRGSGDVPTLEVWRKTMKKQTSMAGKRVTQQRTKNGGETVLAWGPP